MKVWGIFDSIDKITEEAVRSSATSLVPSGSVLLVNRSGILKHTLPVGIARRPVAINQDIKALICGREAHPDYIARIVKAAEPVVLGWVRATTADNFPIENLRQLSIPLPPLPEQNRIAAILDQADALRRLRRRALDRLNTLGQAIFQEMFGSADDMPMVALEALTSKIGSGVTPRGGNAAYLESGTPLIRSMNVRDGFFSAKGLAYISDEQARAMTGVAVKAGDVLLNITGASVARTCIAPTFGREARVNQHVAIIRPKPGLSAEYLGDTITRRLFVARVDLVGELDRQEADAADGDLRAWTVERLHQEVSAMSPDNFIVRPHRRAVEKFTAADAWQALTDADRDELVEEIAGLPSAFVDDDVPAKQFDLLLLASQLALLRVEARFASLQRQIRRSASDLESLANIPAVGQQLSLILDVQTDEFWQDITPRMLETVRVKLRDLVKLIEPAERKIIYTDFEDEISAAADAPIGDAAVGMDTGRFKMKVRRFLENHEDHIALQKIRRAEQLTPSDVAELERMFLDEGIGDEKRLNAIRAQGGLGLFFRSLLGLNRHAAKATFSALLDLGSLTASQIQFIDLIVNYLTERGSIDPKLLYESPFTDMNDKGLSGVFPPKESALVLEAVRRIAETAAA